jgi:hypothetical protein
MQPELWISVLEVMPIPGEGYDRDEIPGAFVKGIVRATSGAEAEEALSAALQEIGFLVVVAEETQSLRAVCAGGFRLNKEMKQMVQRARRTGKPQFGSFYTWERDDRKESDRQARAGTRSQREV